MTNLLGPSWKTTSAGLLSLVAGIAHLWFSYAEHRFNETEVMTGATAIIGGIGLMHTRQNNVTSEQAGAKDHTDA